MKPHRSPEREDTRREYGFSLVELLCAVTILGVGLVGILQGMTVSIQSVKESERHTVASYLASGRIELLRADSFLSARSEEGEFDAPFDAYRYEETLTAASLDGLYNVSIRILREGNPAPIYQLESRLFDPPFSSLLDSDTDAAGANSTNRSRRRDATRSHDERKKSMRERRP